MGLKLNLIENFCDANYFLQKLEDIQWKRTVNRLPKCDSVYFPEYSYWKELDQKIVSEMTKSAIMWNIDCDPECNSKPCILRYNIGDGQPEHIDSRITAISASLLLKKSDKGGQMVICRDNFDIEPGTLVIFPAFIPHEINTVEYGERISITRFLSVKGIRNEANEYTLANRKAAEKVMIHVD